MSCSQHSTSWIDWRCCSLSTDQRSRWNGCVSSLPQLSTAGELLFCYFADISENERKMATISILSLCIPWVWSPASGRPITNASPSSSSSEIMRRYCDMIGLVMMKSPFTDACSPSTDKHAPNCC